MKHNFVQYKRVTNVIYTYPRFLHLLVSILTNIIIFFLNRLNLYKNRSTMKLKSEYKIFLRPS